MIVVLTKKLRVANYQRVCSFRHRASARTGVACSRPGTDRASWSRPKPLTFFPLKQSSEPRPSSFKTWNHEKHYTHRYSTWQNVFFWVLCGKPLLSIAHARGASCPSLFGLRTLLSRPKQEEWVARCGAHSEYALVTLNLRHRNAFKFQNSFSMIMMMELVYERVCPTFPGYFGRCWI